jgi:hypothetical protein
MRRLGRAISTIAVPIVIESPPTPTVVRWHRRSVAEDRSTPPDVRFWVIGCALRGAGSEFFGNPCGVPGKAFVADC